MLPRDSKESYVGSVSDLYESVGSSYGLDASGLRAAGERYGSLNWDTISKMPTPSPDRMERVEKTIYRPATVAYDAGLGDVHLGKNGFSFVDQSADGLNFARSYMMGSIAGKKEHGLMDMYERKAVDSYLGSLRTSKDFQEAYDVLNGENGYEELSKRVKPYYEHPFRGQGEQKGGATTKKEESSIRDFDTSDQEAEYERIYSKREIPDPPSTPETEWNRIHGVTPPMPPAPPVSKQAEAAAPGAGAPQVRFRGNQRETFNSKLGVWVVDDAPPEAEHPEPSPRPRKGVRGKAKRVTNYASTANQQNTSTEGQVEASSSTATPEVSQQTQGNTPAAETPPQQQVENGQVSGTATGQAGAASSEKGSPASGAASVQEHTSTPQEKTQGSTPATGASSEPSTYAKSIKEENDRYTKETAGFDEKRKSLLRADGDQTEALKGLETERAVAARQHGINRIQNAMDAMQGTEAFKTAFAAEHAKHPNLTKSGYMNSLFGNHAVFGNQEKLVQSMQDELGLDKAGREEMGKMISTVNNAGELAAENQRIAKSRYGRFIKAVNSKDGLASMTNEEKIKLLGMNQKAQKALLVQDPSISKEAREAQHTKVLDELITKKAQYGMNEINKAADFQKRVRAGDAEAIYDATHREGKARNAAGRGTAASNAAKKTAAESEAKNLKGLGWKGKAGAAAAILGLGAILGNMMGHHGEQSNAQLYNPNPQPQYAN